MEFDGIGCSESFGLYEEALGYLEAHKDRTTSYRLEMVVTTILQEKKDGS